MNINKKLLIIMLKPYTLFMLTFQQQKSITINNIETPQKSYVDYKVSLLKKYIRSIVS